MSIRAGGEYLTVWTAGRMLGLPIEGVRDVRKEMRVRPAPFGPSAMVGLMNLRGRALAVVDVRAVLDLPPTDTPGAGVVVDVEGVLYGLLIDRAGHVVRPKTSAFAPTPSNLDAAWRDVCQGFFWQDEGLMHVISLPALLRQVVREAA